MAKNFKEIDDVIILLRDRAWELSHPADCAETPFVMAELHDQAADAIKQLRGDVVESMVRISTLRDALRRIVDVSDLNLKKIALDALEADLAVVKPPSDKR